MLRRKKKSAYLYFCEEVRDRLRQENPTLSLTELGQELISRWGMTDKTKYKALGEEDSARYNREKAEYDQSKQNKNKDPNAPQKAKSSFMFFCEDMQAGQRQKHPTPNYGELNWRWQKLADKTKYEVLAEEDSARYAREKAEYDQSRLQPPKTTPVVETSSKPTLVPCMQGCQHNLKRMLLLEALLRCQSPLEGMCTICF